MDTGCKWMEDGGRMDVLWCMVCRMDCGWMEDRWWMEDGLWLNVECLVDGWSMVDDAWRMDGWWVGGEW